MHLKRLEVYGFKSFASKSVLDFEHENKKSKVTAVVGPNGSGKSNVADAIRWVLGEQSGKVLRSKKTEDIIFAGSASKPRGSYAEISMTLSDDNPFKVEINNKHYEFNEIEIGRKLYRSGESEYLINRKKVRLLDLQQLLAQLGFGQSSYTVIGQGMVDRLLFFNPAERKVLFDEAAGVKQYELKREQAIRKLESTDGNLTRLRDILTELEPRVVNLRRLVKRAEGRTEIEGELSNVQNKYYASLIFEYQKGLGQLEKEKEELNKKITQESEKIAVIEGRLEVFRKESGNSEKLKGIEDKLSVKTAERDLLMQEVAVLEARINQKEQAVLSVIREKETLERDKVTLTEKVKFLSARIQEGNKAIQELEKEHENISKKVAALTVKKSGLDSRLGEISNETDSKEAAKVRQLLSEKENQRSEVLSKIYGLKNEINNTEQEKRRTEARREQLQTELDKVNVELRGITEGLETESKIVTTLSKEKQNIDKKANEMLNKITLAEKELAESFNFSQDEVAVFETELERVIAEFKEVKVKPDKDKLEKFWSKIESIFAKIGKLTNAINKNKRADFEEKLQSLRAEQKEIIFEQNRLSLEISKKENQVEYAKQRLENLKERKASAEKELKGLVAAKEFDFTNELKGLEQTEAALIEEIRDLSEKVQGFAKSVAEREHQILAEKNSIQEQEAEVRRELYQLELELSKKRSLLENQTNETKNAERRLEDIETQLLNTKVEQKEASESEELKAKKEQLASLNQDLIRLRSEMSEEVASQREQSSLIFEKEGEKRTIENALSAIRDEINRIELEKAKIQTRFEDLNEEILITGVTVEKEEQQVLQQSEKDLMRAKMETLKRRLETIGSVDPETVSEYEELEKRSNEMSTQVDDLTKAKSDLEKVIKELDEKIKTQFSSAFAHIAKEFNRYFEILFNGGKANLSLGEDEEGNYGIEISANPPGKRVSSLNVLSGGERTLTSLALLFAILSINPSPFCVLDEVDAALDESNTLRFSRILDDLSKKTQFIIISHNRETMKAADTLYGVTMDTDHISKLISVRLNEAIDSVC